RRPDDRGLRHRIPDPDRPLRRSRCRRFHPALGPPRHGARRGLAMAERLRSTVLLAAPSREPIVIATGATRTRASANGGADSLSWTGDRTQPSRASLSPGNRGFRGSTVPRQREHDGVVGVVAGLRTAAGLAGSGQPEGSHHGLWTLA